MTEDCEQIRMTIGPNFTSPALLNCDFAINKPDFKMSQTCKVCGEPAAGFHFGAFTCEGCKSFFGRSYNNINAINDCKNNNRCVINKKNRTACKSCRLRKCLLVGMSKSGSRYGRRSNWFKIHCLLQEQQQKHFQENGEEPANAEIAPPQITPPPPPATHPQMNMRLFGASAFAAPSLIHLHQRAREEMMYSLDEPFRPSASPSVSSPESHNSDSSIEVTEGRRMPLVPGLISSAAFLHSQNLLFPYPPFYPGVLSALPQTAHYNRHATNNNNNERAEHLPVARREYLEAVLQMQQRQHEASPATEERRKGTEEEVEEEEEEEEEVDVQIADPMSPEQDTPIDLSVRSERGSSPATSERSAVSMSTERGNGSDGDEESPFEAHNKAVRTIPLDLRRK